MKKFLLIILFLNIWKRQKREKYIIKKEVENAYKSIIAQKDERINRLVTNNVQLHKKVEHLEERVNQLQKEKTLSHTVPGTEKKKSHSMDLLKEMQSKSIDISKASQELRELNNKNKGQELSR